MKLSRRGKSARRGKHTKRAGKHLRYRGKKVRASKRYHRAHKRTYKRGRRFHRGGVLPPGDADADDDDEPEKEPSPFAIPRLNAQELQELPRVVPEQFNKKLHLYYTKTSGFTSRLSVEDKDFDVSVKPSDSNTTSPIVFELIMTRLGGNRTVKFEIDLTVNYNVFDPAQIKEDQTQNAVSTSGTMKEKVDISDITYIDSKQNKQFFYVKSGVVKGLPGGFKGLLNVKSNEDSIYDFPTSGGTAYVWNGAQFLAIRNSIETQIKTMLASSSIPLS